MHVLLFMVRKFQLCTNVVLLGKLQIGLKIADQSHAGFALQLAKYPLALSQLAIYPRPPNPNPNSNHNTQNLPNMQNITTFQFVNLLQCTIAHARASGLHLANTAPSVVITYMDAAYTVTLYLLLPLAEPALRSVLFGTLSVFTKSSAQKSVLTVKVHITQIWPATT